MWRCFQPQGRKMSKLFSFLKDESGATPIEYGIIAAGLSVALITAAHTIGGTLNDKLAFIAAKIGN